MNMTALHILSCNPNVTAEKIKILKAAYPEAASKNNVMGMTPLELFLLCKGIKSEEVRRGPPSMRNLMRLGLKYGELENILSILATYFDNNEEFKYAFTKQDETSGLLPFMDAASLYQCGLDLVYMLAMRHPELLSC